MRTELYWTIDIGGTKMLLLLIDSLGKVLYKEKKATPKPADPTSLAEAIKLSMNAALKETGLGAVKCPAGLGISIAGFVDHLSGTVHQSPNLEWHKPVPLGRILQDHLECPVITENDANAAVVGEVYYGAARGHNNVIYVTLSTGIGGGLFLDGKLFRGSDGFGGEIGHTKPFGRGRVCKCDGNNCLETWASGSALVKSAETLWEYNEVENRSISTSWVFEQADAGNTLAKTIIEQAIQNIGLGLSNLITILNPTCMVIGGGVAANRPDFFEQVVEKIKIEAIKPAVEITPIKIVQAQLEPEAGNWGIYALLTGQAK